MKNIKRIIALMICMIGISGCGKATTTGKGIQSTNAVDKVIQNQISSNSIEESKEDESNLSVDNSVKNLEKQIQNMGTVDYDLTQMGTDMVYATVYQMMTSPEQYEGKTFRINGTFYASYYEVTKKYYYYCIIKDATACCAQGMEFVWGDGTHIYPDEYPKDNSDIIVEGRFETYREDGDKNLYCRLADSIIY